MKHFFNYYHITDSLETPDEVVLMTYLAINSGNRVARTYRELFIKLNISLVRRDLLRGFLVFIPERASLQSVVDPGEPYGFVNPNVLTSDLDPKTKVQYIRLAILLTTYQRWCHKLWNTGLYIPWFKEHIPTLPQGWIQQGNNTLRLLKEEEYYGKKVD